MAIAIAECLEHEVVSSAVCAERRALLAAKIQSAIDDETRACMKIAYKACYLPKLDDEGDWSQDAVDAVQAVRNQVQQAIHKRLV